jgi:hypothetical protein
VDEIRGFSKGLSLSQINQLMTRQPTLAEQADMMFWFNFDFQSIPYPALSLTVVDALPANGGNSMAAGGGFSSRTPIAKTSDAPLGPHCCFYVRILLFRTSIP